MVVVVHVEVHMPAQPRSASLAELASACPPPRDGRLSGRPYRDRKRKLDTHSVASPSDVGAHACLTGAGCPDGAGRARSRCIGIAAMPHAVSRSRNRKGGACVADRPCVRNAAPGRRRRAAGQATRARMLTVARGRWVRLAPKRESSTGRDHLRRGSQGGRRVRQSLAPSTARSPGRLWGVDSSSSADSASLSNRASASSHEATAAAAS
jgi:hypothetical protein